MFTVATLVEVEDRETCSSGSFKAFCPESRNKWLAICFHSEYCIAHKFHRFLIWQIGGFGKDCQHQIRQMINVFETWLWASPPNSPTAKFQQSTKLKCHQYFFLHIVRVYSLL